MDVSDYSYPACVGLSRCGGYPNTVNECWNDMKPRKVPIYLRLFPMSWIGLNSKGTYLKGPRKRGKAGRAA